MDRQNDEEAKLPYEQILLHSLKEEDVEDATEES
jgi:hypothetical protein